MKRVPDKRFTAVGIVIIIISVNWVRIRSIESLTASMEEEGIRLRNKGLGVIVVNRSRN